MPKKKTKQGWDLRTNIGDAPGSQGTLFSGGRSELSDKRWHRGYDPERLNAVADAVITPTIRNFGAGRTEKVTGRSSMHYRDRQVRGADGMEWQSNAENRNLVDNIARSTVPLGHLNGVQFRTNADANMKDELGHYDIKGDAMTRGDAVIRLRSGQADTSTTIHEIGHHVSMLEGNEHGALARLSGPNGHEEAYADNYAETHFRDRRGRPRWIPTYAGGQFVADPEKYNERFWADFHGNRRVTVEEPEARAEAEDHLRRYPEDRVHPDNTVDVPLIEKGFVMHSRRGLDKPRIDLNPEALP